MLDLGLCPSDSGMLGSFRLLPKHQSFIVSAETKGMPCSGVIGYCSEGSLWLLTHILKTRSGLQIGEELSAEQDNTEDMRP